jgi:hypothetical protein
MAFYPCDFGPHFNPRRNYLAYVGVGSGTQFDRWRLRFCALHLRAVQEHLSEFKWNPEDGALSGGDLVAANCLSCGQPIDQTGRQLFVTCYPPDDEREDYWARIHVDCTVPDVVHDRWSSKSA